MILKFSEKNFAKHNWYIKMNRNKDLELFERLHNKNSYLRWIRSVLWQFLYSHHENDLEVGQALNSFNLVRIRLFEDNKSLFKKKCDFARNDERAKSLLAE